MAINPDSIPSSEQVRETLFDRIYYPYQKQILGVATVLAVGVLAFLGIRWKHEVREDEMWNRFYRLEETEATTPEAARERVASLEALVREYPEDSVTPHAMRAIVFAHEAAGEWEEAQAALDNLADKYGDYDLFKVPTDPKSSASRTIADQHASLIKKEIEWRETSVYHAPKPDESRLALVETNKGSFWIAFFPEQAPEHVAAFVRHAKQGDFNRTQFFEIRKSTEDQAQLLLAGSRASKDWAHPIEHDRDEPTDVIAPEESRFSIRHQLGVVSAVKMPSGESSMAFMIVTDKDGFRRYDGDSSPFGVILLDREGSRDTIAAIANSPTYGTNPDTKDMAGILPVRSHPYPYVYIRRVSIFSDEKLEAGHEWDTVNVSQPKPEPWETDLAPAWKPDPAKTPVVKDTTPDENEKNDDSEDSHKENGDDPEKKDEGSEDTGSETPAK